MLNDTEDYIPPSFLEQQSLRNSTAFTYAGGSAPSPNQSNPPTLGTTIGTTSLPSATTSTAATLKPQLSAAGISILNNLTTPLSPNGSVPAPVTAAKLHLRHDSQTFLENGFIHVHEFDDLLTHQSPWKPVIMEKNDSLAVKVDVETAPNELMIKRIREHGLFNLNQSKHGAAASNDHLEGASLAKVIAGLIIIGFFTYFFF